MLSLLTVLLDRRDDRRARRLRERYGREAWLVSWHRLGSGTWIARLSCPQWPETVEARGASRLEAIRRADRRLHAALRAAELRAGRSHPF